MTNTANETLPTVYRIPAAYLPQLDAAIAKIQRRAAKLGIDAATLGYTVVDTVTTEDELTGALETTLLVTARGAAPRVAGWLFVAKLEHLGTVDGIALGNLVKACPDVTIGADELARYRTVDSGCDHCRVMRRRNDTYILRHDDGRTMQVGSTCIADFLGGESPERALAMLAFVGDIIVALGDGEGYTGGGREAQRVGLRSFLAAVVSVAKADGWVSRKAAMGTDREATASAVWRLIFPATYAERKEAQERLAAVSDADRAFASDAVAAAQELASGASALNDYEHNLSVIAQVPAIDRRMAGLAASLYIWHARRIEQEIARRAAQAVSHHVGEVKGKLVDVPVTLVRVNSFDSTFGVTHIHNFVDASGNALVWKTGSVCLNVGQTYHLSATVKAHSEFRGVKQTEVTRAVCNTDAEQAAKLATLAAARAEKAVRRRAPRKAKAAECPGHESTEGPAGVSVYCDGTCR